MNKEELIEKIQIYKDNKNYNRMGCSENWYSFVYAMKETFSLEKIKQMSQREVDLLFKLANNIQERLW